jgi:hypothetical protein
MFFPPNITSWMRPMDLGIIATLKEMYKYLLIENIILYYDNPDSVKNALEYVTKKMNRGEAGVAFGWPTHLFDAANFISIASNEIKQELTLFYCFKKANLVRKFNMIDVEVFEVGEDDCINELVS